MKTPKFIYFTAKQHCELCELGSQDVDTCGLAFLVPLTYLRERLNGNEKSDAPPFALPKDGRLTWLKGRVVGGCISGILESDGFYHHECRYDEGPGDRKWMVECDRNYLARLYLIGANTPDEIQDLAENRDIAAKAAEEVKKMPEEQLSAALKKLYITVIVPKILFEITLLPTELVALSLTYLTGKDIAKEMKEVNSATISYQTTDKTTISNVAEDARQSAALTSIALSSQSLWSHSMSASSSSSVTFSPTRINSMKT